MNHQEQQLSQKTWWGPIWRGLVADSTGKHYRAMKGAIWLFLYLVIHADRKTGKLSRRYETIANDTGMNKRTIRYWLLVLRKQGYVKVERMGGSLAIYIQIQKWKSIVASRR